VWGEYWRGNEWGIYEESIRKKAYAGKHTEEIVWKKAQREDTAALQTTKKKPTLLEKGYLGWIHGNSNVVASSLG
jgi:hypothetical protein